MSKMGDLMIDIQEDISLGVLSFKQIAEKHNVPTSWVDAAWEALCEQELLEDQHFNEGFDNYKDLGDSWYDDQYELDTDYV